MEGESKKLDIVFAGTAHPYRGGIASFNEMLARTLQNMGHRVRIQTFTVQYPAFLFPGKSQYTDASAPQDLSIVRQINSVNPFNWISRGFRLLRMRPDVLFLRYWSPYLAPCLGTIGYIARMNRHTKVIVLADNITPHEKHFYDRLLTRYLTGSAHGFLVMSSEVERDLRTFTRTKPVLLAPHPVYQNYGDPVPRETACRNLNLDPAYRYALFFGFIRKYKGLDLLLESWSSFRKEHSGMPVRLIVAGEFYVDKQPYTDLIASLGIADSVILHDRFIADSEVKDYFCLSDMVVQPYRSATQSGVTQIAYHFDVPMIVTNVGGLPEIVPDGEVGYVTGQCPEEIAAAITRCFDPENHARFVTNVKVEKKRFSWEHMAATFERLYCLVRPGKR